MRPTFRKAALLASCLAYAQGQVPRPATIGEATAGRDLRPHFEVATVKPSPPPSKPNTPEARGRTSGGPGTDAPRRFQITNFPLSVYVEFAYSRELGPGQFITPAWLSQFKPTPHYDLVANVPSGATRNDVYLMLQVLLEERFKLKWHKESREISVYELVVAKGGPKLKVSAIQSGVLTVPTKARAKDKDGFPILNPGPDLAMILSLGAARARGQGQAVAELARFLTAQLGQQVIDHTGLAGRYDFSLAFETSASAGLPAHVRGSIDANSDLAGVNVFGAVQQQLGLKLQPAKTKADVVIIDSVEKVPTAN